ncbi:MAG: chromate efflux transporter [Magnetococcales bacterium]|nr:chromate efflux transporter [Magnetococcales bacterium]
MPTATSQSTVGRLAEIFFAFLRLGLTSFGGPVAHLGYFRQEFVVRRQWLDEAAYADLVALSQFLPGPASSQVGMGLGLSRGGYGGLLLAWLGFTLPSALIMLLFAYGVGSVQQLATGHWLHGFKVVAVAVVAQAVWGMAKTLCPDRNRATFALLAALLTLSWPTALGQVGAILAGALGGWLWLREPNPTTTAQPTATKTLTVPISKGAGLFFLLLFFLLLLLLPVLATHFPHPMIALLDSFYRSGALVFGGGHVMLPLLQAEVVSPQWINKELFLAGYGMAQAIPGPLSTFAAYLGAAMAFGPGGWLGGTLAVITIFLPSLLLILGAMPFWALVRHWAGVQSALRGVNAAVVGLLLAALYHPVWTSGILSVHDFSLGLAAFGLLHWWRLPPWLVVFLTATGAVWL